LDDANVDLPNILSELEYVLNNINITESDVVDLLNILDISKAIGPDGISPRILKEGASILKYPLCKIFNISLQSGVFTSDWKKANVCPVFKKDSPALLQNYLPISLISIVGKVMERCVFKHINNYLLNHDIITHCQFGFTKGDSAINQLVDITNNIGKALADGKEFRIVFCDVSKAFDKVWHRGLLNKLKNYGFGGNIIIWLEHYLQDRLQCRD
jgi:hypothetical protein